MEFKSKTAFYLYPSVWNNLKINLRRYDNLIYKGELPDYVLNLCNKLSINLIPDEDLRNYDLDDQFIAAPPLKEVEENGENVKYVDEDKMWGENWGDITDEKIFYIECNDQNVCTTLFGMRKYKMSFIYKALKTCGYECYPIFWKEMINSLNEAQIKVIEKFDGIVLGSVFEMDKYQPRKMLYSSPDVKDSITEREYIHIITNGVTTLEPIYRRHHLNEKLKEKYGDALSTDTFLGLNKAKLTIVSHPTFYVPLSDKVFYDRTDNWTGNTDCDEEEILSEAGYVTCSSKWLYQNTIEWLKKNRPNDNVPVKYIPNGNVHYDYPKNIEKFERKTAIYVGNRLNKVDLQMIMLLCEINPDWDFRIYAEEASALRSLPDNLYVHDTIPLDELFPVICKCHLGLCLFKTQYWTLGMLPNKLFNYINARIPTIYSGIPDINMEDYKEVAFNISDIESLTAVAEKQIPTKIYDKLFRSFDDVTKEVIECIDEYEKM